MNLAKTINETEKKLYEVLNNSGLNIAVLELIVRGVYNDIRISLQKELVKEDDVDGNEGN